MRIDDIKRFYKLLQELESKIGGKKILANCNGRLHWPVRGVYFFFEEGELRTNSGDGLRVVRAGTHALKKGAQTSLWGRLKQHKGVDKNGGGNHRGSVFRLHVGGALINRDRLGGKATENWGIGNQARRIIRELEHPIEQVVSRYIRHMPFLYLCVPDIPGPESMRGYIERNTIALLSNYNQANDSIDLPSAHWLGNWATQEQIRKSGLWNIRHVDQEYDSVFLHQLAKLIRKDCIGL